MNQLQGIAGDECKVVAMIRQTSEHACTAFGRFVEQQGTALICLGQWLDHQLGFLDLEGHFDATLEGSLQGSHGLQRQGM